MLIQDMLIKLYNYGADDVIGKGCTKNGVVIWIIIP